MSLQTDIIFIKALRSDMELIDGLPARDIYGTAIAMPEEDADNAPLPYVIVAFNGLNNQDSTKDDSFGGLSDTVTIGIEVAARTRPELARLTIRCRQVIDSYFKAHAADPTDEDYDLIPCSYEIQAGPVMFDDIKPCFWQKLTYNCITDPD